MNCNKIALHISLNPRFDGAFLNYLYLIIEKEIISLNPRFDGAFLNFSSVCKSSIREVLIPDLMGLF